MLRDTMNRIANLFALRTGPVCFACQSPIPDHTGGVVTDAGHTNAFGMREKQCEYRLCGDCYRPVSLAIASIVARMAREHRAKLLGTTLS